mgnify:CR=1 FL=1
MKLNSYNSKHTEYNNILYQLDELHNYRMKRHSKLNFSTSGKLIICLIEFRKMIEIKYVIYALLSIYNPEEIGLAFVYGNLNKEFIEETFKDFKNVKLIKYDFDNINRGIYSAILKTPEFYEHFLNWSHLLIYQTDALLLRKIDDIYFNYDYTGAPWIKDNQWCKYNAGNGGFSLRNIKKAIKVCEINRSKNILLNVHRGNEDGFFCNQDSFNYIPINSDLHKAFSVERVYYSKPIGCHQIYHSCSFTNKEWKEFIKYMEVNLIYMMNDCPDINYLIAESNNLKYKILEKELKKTHIPDLNFEKNLIKINEVINSKKHIGPFELIYENIKRNKWQIKSTVDYEIIFSLDTNENNKVKSHKVSKYVNSTIHKKENGVYFKQDDNNAYIIFYPGFPNGGECWADIHANGHYNHCKDLPKNGAIILKASKNTVIESKSINTIDYKINTNYNILAFDLFTGVGFYNQLFSLEFAVYLAHITNRYLILNIKNPLVACGKPDKKYGILLDYISDEFKKYLVGFEVRNNYNYIDPKEYEIILPNKISNCVFIDISNNFSKKEIDEFVHHRQIVDTSTMKKIYGNDKMIYISKSNASRVFYNFLTTKENYLKMNKIALTLSILSEPLFTICKNIELSEVKETVGIHLRLGDWHKSVNTITLKKILDNINNWLSNNNNYKKILLMTDKESSLLNEGFNNYKIVNTDSYITENIKNLLNKKYTNTAVATFLIQQYLLTKCNAFIGSQGSTVSVYIQYLNYINNKEYELYAYSECSSYNNIKLKHDIVNSNKLYEWSKKNYMGGHPISWSLFFNDNIEKTITIDESISNINLDIKEVSKIENKILELETSKKVVHNTNRTEKNLLINDKVNNYESNSEPFMSIDIWINECDIFIDNRRSLNNLQLFVSSCCKEKIIIGIKTDLLFTYINLLSNINKYFILITLSNDDHCPPYLQTNTIMDKNISLDIEKLLESQYLIKWFAKNPCKIHYKIYPYILGPKWQWRTTRFNGENKSKMLNIYNKYCMNPQYKFYNRKLKKELLYFNFTVGTTNNPLYNDHKNIRRDIKNNLINKFNWIENTEFEAYIKNLETYKFCICPPGRGIDTHRCWEALMVGTIPIVLSSSLNSLYINLPVLIVENFTVITEQYLIKEYNEILQRTYSFEKLYSHYWKNELFKLKL